jgi:hypothetical protein
MDISADQNGQNENTNTSTSHLVCFLYHRLKDPGHSDNPESLPMIVTGTLQHTALYSNLRNNIQRVEVDVNRPFPTFKYPQLVDTCFQGFAHTRRDCVETD